MNSSRKVFISYSSKDRDFCEKIAKVLIENSFQIWMDKYSIQGGEEWATSIDSALRECTDLIAVHSSNSLNYSYHAKGEWFHAYDLGKRIYPIIIEEGISVHPNLRHIHGINFAAPGTFEEHIKRLIDDMLGKNMNSSIGNYELVNGKTAEYPLFYNGAGMSSTEFIMHAKEICHMAGLGHSFIVLNQQALRKYLGAGAKLKIILSAPTDINLRTLATWTAQENPNDNFEHLQRLKRTLVEDLRVIIKYTPPQSIELRVLDVLPPFSMIQFDPNNVDNGYVLLTMYPFNPASNETQFAVRPEVIARPTTILRRKIYPALYDHYRLRFSDAWQFAKPMTIDEFEQAYVK